jgi:two-component system LytT family response regulator
LEFGIWNLEFHETFAGTAEKNLIFVENSFMIKAVIVDDEANIREAVALMVRNCCPNVTIVALAEGVKAAVGAINENEADLVITDIRLTDGSGFDIVRHFDKPDFRIIFMSARNDYAIKAIKFNAVDYLLKPIDEKELTLAVNKAVDMIRFEENLQQKALGESIKELNKSHRLVLRSADQVHVVNIEDIVHVEADSNYASFFMHDGRKIVVSKAMGEFEESLLEHGLHRVHRSHLININKMSYFDKADGGFLVMIDGACVPVASRKKDMLMELFEGLE